MVHVGIVGLGYMAATHLKAYRELPGARVSALCNPSGRHLDGDFGSILGNLPGQQPLKWDMTGVKAYRTVEQLLGDPALDLIDICTPTPSHPALVLGALRAGKHVLCEKPLARTSGQAREMAAAAREHQRLLMPAMCMRFFPEWLWLKRAIDSGTYGKILGAHFVRVAEAPGWGQANFLDGEKSGGGLLDLHIHDSDFVQYCFGRPCSVYSTGFSKVSGAIDHVVTQYDVSGGACVSAEGSWAMSPGFGFRMRYTAVFERATADYDLARGKEALKLNLPGQPAQTPECPGGDAYREEIHYLLQCIESKRPLHTVTAEDAVGALEICEAEEKSIRTRERIRLIGKDGMIDHVTDVPKAEVHLEEMKAAVGKLSKP